MQRTELIKAWNILDVLGEGTQAINSVCCEFILNHISKLIDQSVNTATVRKQNYAMIDPDFLFDNMYIKIFLLTFQW